MISRKTAKVRYTYEQIASARAQQPEIAKILNLSENCVYRNIKSLRDKNIIIRIGANKNKRMLGIKR